MHAAPGHDSPTVPEAVPSCPPAVRDTGPQAPRFGRVLAAHIVFMFLNSFLFANVVWLVPMLVRLRFGSPDPYWRDWQTMLVTAAIPSLLMFSIFWGALLRRLPLPAYLAVYWLVAVLPLLCAALVQSYGQLLACHLVAAIGYAGWMPLNGKLLKHLYGDAVRGRAFAVIDGVRLGSSVVTAYLVGRWVEAYPGAFRVYFVAAVAAQLAGMLILVWLIRVSGAGGREAGEPVRSWTAIFRPILHMHQVLRADRTFRRYELAFMTYGAAIMFCDALLPVLATTRLHMRYEDYAHSTQVVRCIVSLLMLLPCGWLLDRVGPIRTSGAAFAVLALYPLLLLTADGRAGIALASVILGIGFAGVSMGWTLGPVMLAGQPDRVPHYAAIHATLVGVRGTLFQGLGMLLYKLTGGFAWPLIACAAGFLIAAALMWRLHRTVGGPLRSAG